MARSRKVVGCYGIKGQEGAGRGTAVLIYRSGVMWPCYVTRRQHEESTLGPHLLYILCDSVSAFSHLVTGFDTRYIRNVLL